MFGTILLCFIINTFYLEKYYVSRKIDALHKAYKSVKTAAEDGNLEQETYLNELKEICVRDNLSLLVMDMDSRITICVGAERETLQNVFYRTIFESRGPEEVIEKHESEDGTEYYILQNVPDFASSNNYLQMWGKFDDNHFFLMRSSVESIKESVETANRFLAVTGLIASIVGGIIIYFTSYKITKPIIEELRRRNDQLEKDIEEKEKIDEMRREFLSNVTHELKTPIALIQGYAEGLKENINEDEESRNTYCDIIIDESAKMNNMVKKLLNLNELENGTNILNPVEFDITELISNYIKKQEVFLEQNGIKVLFENKGAINVLADEFATEEVLANYFSNALNHVKGDKTIEIKCIRKEETVRVSVVNSGDPIPADSVSHIWEKFYKVDKARTREYGGSGVGLSIVKAIMEAMGRDYGVMNYDNAVEFWFELSTV